jgi:hypothetical protein
MPISRRCICHLNKSRVRFEHERRTWMTNWTAFRLSAKTYQHGPVAVYYLDSLEDPKSSMMWTLLSSTGRTQHTLLLSSQPFVPSSITLTPCSENTDHGVYSIDYRMVVGHHTQTSRWLVGRLELSPTALVNGVTFRELRDGLCFEDLYQSRGNFTLRIELGQSTRHPPFDDEVTTPVRWNSPLESAPFVTT